jgi:hypothetical protein
MLTRILLVLVSLVIMAADTNHKTSHAATWHTGYKPCVTEDSDGPCYWDASVRGNHEGRSFTVTKTQKVVYQ